MSLSHLRPLSFGEILDGAFMLYRRHFSVFFVSAFLPYLAVIAVEVATVLTVAADPSGTSDGLAAGVLVMLRLPLMLCAYVFATAALIRQTSQAYLGGEVSRADGYRVAAERFWILLGTSLLYGLAIAAGLVMLVVPGILLGLMLFAYGQVTVLERSGGGQALLRSRALADGAWGRVFCLGLVLSLIGMLPTFALGLGAALWIPMMGEAPRLPHGVAALVPLGMRVLSTLLLPLSVAGMTLLYYDRRVRVEGLDVQAAADGLAAA